MSIIGSGWKEEPTSIEVFNEIMGYEIFDESELKINIEKALSSHYTSKIEREKLLYLQLEIYNENK